MGRFGGSFLFANKTTKFKGVNMSVLWCGGEDIDFPNNGGSVIVNPSNANWRTGYARCAVVGSMAESLPFQGGPVTSVWLSFVIGGILNGNNQVGIGVGKSGTTSGIFVGTNGNGAGSNALTVSAYNGSTATTLVSSAAGIYSIGVVTLRVALQIISFGATGTVNLYVNSSLVATYTGNLIPSGSGITNLDTVVLNNISNGGFSEIIVSDESPLGWQGLVTASPNGNGATQSWTNPGFANVDPGQDDQYTLPAQPAGTFAIKAVKVVARAMATAGAASTNIELGFNNTNTSVVAVGSSQAVTSAFEPYEEYFATDPTSSGGTAAWGTSLSGYELDIRSV
jgi:hypothetical protein